MDKNHRIIEKLDRKARKRRQFAYKVGNIRMMNKRIIRNRTCPNKKGNRRTLEVGERKLLKLTIKKATNLNKINLKGRINAANNKVNLCHNLKTD